MGDIGPDGNMGGHRTLDKILNVWIDAEPDTVTDQFDGDVRIQLSLQAVSDSVNVRFPKITGSSSGALMLEDIASENVFIYLPDEFELVDISELIGPEVQTWDFGFELKPGDLPTGQFRVLPYFIIEQDSIPVGLRESLDPHFGEIGPDFMNIPLRPFGGNFVVLSAP